MLAKHVPAALRRQRWRRPYQQSTWHRLQKRHRDEYQRSGDERERRLLTLSAITGEREERNLCAALEGTVLEKFPVAPLRGGEKKNCLDEAERGFFYSPFRFCRLQSDASDDIPIRAWARYKVRRSDQTHSNYHNVIYDSLSSASLCFHGAHHRLQRPSIDFLSSSQFSNLSPNPPTPTPHPPVGLQQTTSLILKSGSF